MESSVNDGGTTGRLICGSVEGELGGRRWLDQLFCDVLEGELLVLVCVCIGVVLSWALTPPGSHKFA